MVLHSHLLCSCWSQVGKHTPMLAPGPPWLEIPGSAQLGGGAGSLQLMKDGPWQINTQLPCPLCGMLLKHVLSEDNPRHPWVACSWMHTAWAVFPFRYHLPTPLLTLPDVGSQINHLYPNPYFRSASNKLKLRVAESQWFGFRVLIFNCYMWIKELSHKYKDAKVEENNPDIVKNSCKIQLIPPSQMLMVKCLLFYRIELPLV